MHCNNHHPLSKEHMKKNRKTEKRKRERDGADISKMREIFLKADNSEKKTTKQMFSRQKNLKTKKRKKDIANKTRQRHDAQQKEP